MWYSTLCPLLVCMQIMEAYNHYITEHPGYYYNWIAPLQQWGLKWKPIKNTYSPPKFDNSLQWIHLSPPKGLNMNDVIGDGDMHCQELAEEIGATYIHHRQDLNKIEIWAQDITGAMTKMSIQLNKIKQQANKN